MTIACSKFELQILNKGSMISCYESSLFTFFLKFPIIVRNHLRQQTCSYLLRVNLQTLHNMQLYNEQII